MDKQFKFPKPPGHLQIPSNHVYLGTGNDVPTLCGNYHSYYHSNNNIGNLHPYKSSFDGDAETMHYSVEFGSPAWNRWAEAKFDLPTIPDDCVWIGIKPSDHIDGVLHFGGGLLTLTGEFWEFSYYDGSSDNHYIIMKTTFEYQKVVDSFINVIKNHTIDIDEVLNDYCKPQTTPDPTLEQLESKHQELVKSYQKAKEELEEARANGWLIQCGDDAPQPILDEHRYTIYNNKLKFSTLWATYEPSQWTILKDHPSFTINGHKPEYHDKHWNFGCAKILHNLVEQLVTTHDDIGETVCEYKGITSVTIGAGTFTMDQLIELNNYRKKKQHV